MTNNILLKDTLFLPAGHAVYIAVSSIISVGTLLQARAVRDVSSSVSTKLSLLMTRPGKSLLI